MNIAILLGVSEYQNSNPLPACKNDVDFVTSILEATGKYDNNILHISEKTNASNVKEKITNKIEEMKDKTIDEVFFYYSGHGLYEDNEFYYILSDYDEDKLKQTSLENSELDNWLRSLNPDMTIKVVDACNSGMMYVKGTDQDIEKHLFDSFRRFNKTNELNGFDGAFNKCYFMFSSKLDESSFIYKESKFSLFTESFIDAFKFYDSNEIRYKDIIDYVSDRFSKITKKQTPIFITQAHNTEKFCSMNPIKKLFSKPKPAKVIETESEKIKQEKESEIETKELVSIIEKDSEYYLEKKEVIKFLEEIKILFQNHKYGDEFKSLYNLNNMFLGLSDYDNVPKLDVIGEWLDNNENEYFAEAKTERKIVKYPVSDRIYSVTQSFANQLRQLSPEYQRVVTGYSPKVELPYDLIKIEANPNYPNISLNECIIAFVLSRTEIKFFFSYVNYKHLGWDNYEIDSEGLKWEVKEFKYKNKDDIKEFISNILNNFENHVIKGLNEKFTDNSGI